jgi:nucleotide-binding universal stress UspA family protein
MIVDHELTKDDLRDIADRLEARGKRFLAGAAANQPEWRSVVESPTEFLIREARAGDLLIIGRDRDGDLGRSPWRTFPTRGSGRRRLEGHPRSAACRSGFAATANKVCIVEVSEAGAEDEVRAYLDGVAAYLNRHRITVTSEVTAHTRTSPADELIALTKAGDADLIVAGAYGHSRIGVTRVCSLRLQSAACFLISGADARRQQTAKAAAITARASPSGTVAAAI